jgi:Lon protease-like protein
VPVDASLDGVELPMFPLGTVLFPHGVLPLRVFEPRYRVMVAHCLEQDARFGVVLIERGSEVGGGDTRFHVGTVAQIVQAARAPDGRFSLATVGTDRIDVVEWLPDDPYPRAIVRTRAEGEPARDGTEIAGDVCTLLLSVHELRAGLGEPAHTGEVVLSPDLVRASYEAALLSPLGPLDAQALLELDDAVDRLEALAECLRHEVELLRFRLSG